MKLIGRSTDWLYGLFTIGKWNSECTRSAECCYVDFFLFVNKDEGGLLLFTNNKSRSNFR